MLPAIEQALRDAWALWPAAIAVACGARTLWRARRASGAPRYPAVLVRDGTLQPDVLRRVRITVAYVAEIARQHGLERIQDAGEIVLEDPSGTVRVTRADGTLQHRVASRPRGGRELRPAARDDGRDRQADAV